MKNRVSKYLIKGKQVRIYILVGKQIQREIEKLSINEEAKNLFRTALNITALNYALNPNKERLSLTFYTKDQQNKITTQAFSNQTMTGMIRLNQPNLKFKEGTLQTITALSSKIGNAYTSYSPLSSGNLYQDMEDYYRFSEQTSTYFIPISNIKSGENIVLLVQGLPFTPAKIVLDVLAQLQTKKASWDVWEFAEVELGLAQLFTDWRFLEQLTIDYRCSCGKEMFLGLIFSLSPDEVATINKKQENLSASCSLCGKSYRFTPGEIGTYLE